MVAARDKVTGNDTDREPESPSTTDTSPTATDNAGVTVTCAVSTIRPLVALIVVVPSRCAVTSPAGLMVAIVGSAIVQEISPVTSRVVLFVYVPVAVYWS